MTAEITLHGVHDPPKMRKNEKKRIGVFWLDGAKGLDNQCRNQPVPQHQMGDALVFQGDDYKCVLMKDTHDRGQDVAIFPESLRCH